MVDQVELPKVNKVELEGESLLKKDTHTLYLVQETERLI